MGGGGGSPNALNVPDSPLPKADRYLGDLSNKAKQAPLLNLLYPTEPEEEDPITLADRPARDVGVSPEDISLGGEVDPAANRLGKRVLSRPKG